MSIIGQWGEETNGVTDTTLYEVHETDHTGTNWSTLTGLDLSGLTNTFCYDAAFVSFGPTIPYGLIEKDCAGTHWYFGAANGWTNNYTNIPFANYPFANLTNLVPALNGGSAPEGPTIVYLPNGVIRLMS